MLYRWVAATYWDTWNNAVVSVEHRGGECVMALLVPARAGMAGFTRTALVALVRIAQ